MLRVDSDDRSGVAVRGGTESLLVIVLLLVIVPAIDYEYEQEHDYDSTARLSALRTVGEADSLRAFMKKVLILSASFGEGHNAAGRGLLAALAQHVEAEATMYDPFPEVFGDVYLRSQRRYLGLIERFPHVWACIYWLLHHTPLIYLTQLGLGGVREALRRKIDALQPDVIVSVYPGYSFLLNRVYPRRAFRFYTVVTDSITINSVWYRSPSDAWFVPNELSAAVMRAAGVPAECVRNLGFPVPPVFAQARPLRLPPGAGEPLRVLFMVNASKRAVPAVVARILDLEGIALTVTVGRDEALRLAIEEVVRRSGKSIELHGWTPNMPELLMKHHVLIGKAGGAAVQEAIAARTPMIVTKVVPGQEEGNARLIVESGAGAVSETPDRIAQTLQSLVADGARRWHEWEASIARLSRPDAAMRMAEEVLR
jgi:processive 1,2-diacylglycerol beta-glucosyltransferase